MVISQSNDYIKWCSEYFKAKRQRIPYQCLYIRNGASKIATVKIKPIQAGLSRGVMMNSGMSNIQK